MKPKIDKTKFSSITLSNKKKENDVLISLALRPKKTHLFLCMDLRVMKIEMAAEFFAVLKELVG